jgi:hypothetical protein
MWQNGFMREKNGGDPDPVRANTAPEALKAIDTSIEEKILYYSTQPKDVVSRRIQQLEREWDIERWLETNASSIALTSLVLGITRSRKYLLLTGTVLSFLLMHAIQGWCPPVPLLRKMGVRTRSEIDREKFALKVLRGDFQDVARDPAAFKHNPTTQVISAVKQA